MALGFIWAGGGWIFGAFLIVFLLAVIFGLYTRSGSGINQRPYNSVYGDSPGAKGSSTVGNDRIAAQRLTRGTR